MKKVEAYKCDYCSKTSTNPSALFQHERKCRHNPNNQHKCFDFCAHLKKSCDSDGNIEFTCLSKNIKMYSYKAEHRNFQLISKIKYLVRMPLECDLHKYMNEV